MNEKNAPAVLTAAQVKRYMKTEFPVMLDVQREVTSTNTLLKGLAEQGVPEGFVLVAESQTAGRGRLGRSFHSPVGTGLYMSILLRPAFSAERALFITTAAAVAVCRAIEQETGLKPQIKWVNDIYLNEKKICGILTESSIDFETKGLKWAVLGIGVNLSEPEGGFPEEIRSVAGALFGKSCSTEMRGRLTAAILDHFFMLYADHLENGAFIEDYRSRSLLTGREIVFSLADHVYRGTVTGISDEAHLMVRLENGEERVFSSGEVQIHKGFARV